MSAWVKSGPRADASSCPLVPKADLIKSDGIAIPRCNRTEAHEIMGPCDASNAMPITRKRRSFAVLVGLRCQLHARNAGNLIVPGLAFATSAVPRSQRYDCQELL